MLQDILACFVLEIETSNPAKRKHHFTDNAGNQQNSEKDTNWKIQVQVIKNREQVAISNILKPGAAGVNALAFKPVVLNYAAVKVSLHFCQDQLKSARGFEGRKATGPRHAERAEEQPVPPAPLTALPAVRALCSGETFSHNTRNMQEIG